MISGPNCSECDGDSQVTVELFGVIVPESHAGKEEGQSRQTFLIILVERGSSKA